MNQHVLFENRTLAEKVLKTLREAIYLHPEVTELEYVLDENDFKWGNVNREDFLSSIQKFGYIEHDEDKGENCYYFHLNQLGFCVANDYSYFLDALIGKYRILGDEEE